MAAEEENLGHSRCMDTPVACMEALVQLHITFYQMPRFPKPLILCPGFASGKPPLNFALVLVAPYE